VIRIVSIVVFEGHAEHVILWSWEDNCKQGFLEYKFLLEESMKGHADKSSLGLAIKNAV